MTGELQQLKDIHLPTTISNWPIAPGWILLYVFSFLLVGYLSYYFYLQRKRYKVIKFALARLNVLENFLHENPENINIAAEISILIRRTALHYFSRHEVAGLTGEQWISFLNRSGRTRQFSTASTLLTNAPYCVNQATNLRPLFALTRAWLKAIVHHPMTAEN